MKGKKIVLTILFLTGLVGLNLTIWYFQLGEDAMQVFKQTGFLILNVLKWIVLGILVLFVLVFSTPPYR